jgi:hypothetical protein
MRRFISAVFVVLCMLGAPTLARAQPATPAQIAQVKTIVAAFPDGGPGLQAAIAAAVEADPTLAGAVVAVAATATPAQQQEIGLGLAEAAAFFQNTGTPTGIATANQIKQIAQTGPPALVFAFNLALASLAAPIAGGSTGSANLTTNKCVSPSFAAATCRP